MKFSVLIPVYNAEKYIRECLDSVMNQTYSDYEVVVVDDGSTDESGTICDEYAERYGDINVIHQQNIGQLYARKTGAEMAKGEFCVFVDADDVVKPELLATLKEYIENNDADMVLYSFVYYDGVNTKKRNKRLFSDGAVLEGEGKRALYESYITGPDYYALWTKCIQTSLITDDSTDYSLYIGKKMSEDVLQSLYPITKAKRIVFADKELYLYRYNPQSVSNTMKADTIYQKNTSHVFALMKDYLPQWGIDDEEHVQKLEAAQFGYAMYTFCLYYKSVPRNDRKKVVDYNWDSFFLENFEINVFCSDVHKKIYKWIMKKQYIKIGLFFWKQKIYKCYKEFTR